jgi:replicative superfamily II helicase
LTDGDWKSWPLARDVLAKGALNGKGLLIAAPTGTGKSTVATMVTIEYMREQDSGYVSVYLVPLKALAEEVYLRFQRELKAANLEKKQIAIATGDYDDPIDFATTSLVVATYEKFNALMGNRKRFSPYVVVADEFQIVGTERRGPLIEGLMTLNFTGPKSLLFALSAVVSNAEEISKWLGVDHMVGTKEHRTVPLIIRGKRTDNPSELVRKIVAEELASPTSSQILVFCSTVPASEKQCKGLTKVVEPTLRPEEKAKLSALSDRLLAISQFNSDVAECCRKGVAYHNAGLTKETRREIEEAFKGEYLKVITCTPTLAQGINTPAKVAIVRDITRFSEVTGMSEWIPVSELLNMVGRAGRPGHKHETGIAYVFNASSKLIEELREGKGAPLTSKLGDSFSNIAKFVLQCIRSKEGATRDTILREATQTLWAGQNKVDGGKNPRTVSIVDYLRTEYGSNFEPGRVQAVEMINKHGGPTITARVRSFTSRDVYDVEFYEGGYSCNHPFYSRGKLCKHISAAIAECLFGNLVSEPSVRDFVFLAAFESIEKPAIPIQISYAVDLLSRWQFIEEKEGSLIVTKQGESAAISYLPIDRLHALWEDVKRIDDSILARNFITMVYSDIKGITKDQVDMVDINSLIEWMDEASTAKLASRYGGFQKFVSLNEEILYALQSCDEFAGILGRVELQSSIKELKRRMRFGVQEELLPLAVLNIKDVKREQYRPLFNNGIKNLEDLKNVEVATLSKVIGDKAETVSAVAKEMWDKLQGCLANPSKVKGFLSTYRINPDNASLLGLEWAPE